MNKKKFQSGWKSRSYIKSQSNICVRAVRVFSKIRVRTAAGVATALKWNEAAATRRRQPERRERWVFQKAARTRAWITNANASFKSTALWLKTGATVAISVLIIFTVVRAGTITPPTGTPEANFYTLSEIYDFIANNTAATEAGHDFTFSSALAGSGRTLTEIYSALAGLVSADQVKLGTTYLGVEGTLAPSGTAAAADCLDTKTFYSGNSWTQKTGSLSTQTLSADNETVVAGNYAATTLSAVDSDLASANIKSGITIFGFAGNANVVDTSSGDALAADIFNSKLAYVDGSELTGLLDLACNTATFDGTGNLVAADYDGAGDGSNRWCITDTGDAVNSDIRLGKIAWIDGIATTGIANIYLYGDDSADNVLTVATGAGDWDASGLTINTVKKGITFATSSTGVYSGYPGTAWSGSGLTESACDDAADWEWFGDANGDGDTTDSEDGVCVKTSTVTSDSWNGGEQVAGSNLGPINAGGGAADSVSSSTAAWTIDAYKNHVVKITSGTASGCWGRVKTNTATAITVYGSWLGTDYSSNCGTPDATSVFSVYDDWGDYDNSFIGDYTCDGTAFPNGAVTHGSYPSSGIMALAEADCYDGTRDLLPSEENDRWVISGTATAADATSITDSSLALDVNVWIGQKVLITGGTGDDSYGFIESNTATAITVTDWIGGADPAAASTFKIIYIVPHATYTPDADIDGDDNDDKANNGSLKAEVLNNWKGTRLPTHSDFFGFCGYKDGGSNYETTTGTYTDDKTYGNRGGQVGRTDEFLDLANSSWEWLSEQHYSYSARIAGGNACSYFDSNLVSVGNRFRSVFRP